MLCSLISIIMLSKLQLICRAAIGESVETREADFFEDLGIETDEAAGHDYSTYSQLLPKKARKR